MQLWQSTEVMTNHAGECQVNSQWCQGGEHLNAQTKLLRLQAEYSRTFALRFQSEASLPAPQGILLEMRVFLICNTHCAVVQTLTMRYHRVAEVLYHSFSLVDYY